MENNKNKMYLEIMVNKYIVIISYINENNIGIYAFFILCLFKYIDTGWSR